MEPNGDPGGRNHAGLRESLTWLSTRTHPFSESWWLVLTGLLEPRSVAIRHAPLAVHDTGGVGIDKSGFLKDE